MRVLFVTDCYPTPAMPQYCVFLQQQAAALQKAGVDVDVYHFSNNDQLTDAAYSIDHTQVFFRVAKQKKRNGVLLVGRLSKADEQELLKILRRGYDCVSFHFGNLSFLRSVQAVCKKAGIPLIHHFHGLNIWGDYFDRHPLLTAYRNILKKRIYAGLSATVNVSEKVKDTFTAEIKNVPSYTVYNGVDPVLFHADAQNKPRHKEKLEVLCVGNMIPIKGQKYLIEAAAKLKENGRKISLVFAGSGPDEAGLKTMCLEKGVDATFCGYVTYDVISKLMAEKDLFVLPSFYEALGCVYLEAMSAGMITVGVHGQGIDEIIEDGVNGFLAEPKSADSICEIIQKAADMCSEESDRMTVRAQETALRFTWENSAASLQKVYQDVIKKTGK